MFCSSNNFPCFKFILTAIISLLAFIFAAVMLGLDQFKNIPLSTFCSSLLSSIIAYWMDSPKMKSDEREQL